ncbi:hypothetical protein DICVIV_07263 [Dictyocaulus viviparus]|uniref:Uncharacterized protein n=1 Tax=Dictyocaulus viviparus TaxID=29172 RepID=A0A0D8XQ31_DICVI|nr:hypothetical protein DICVIV_07263 [Dictyocaulus viviparus]
MTIGCLPWESTCSNNNIAFYSSVAITINRQNKATHENSSVMRQMSAISDDDVTLRQSSIVTVIEIIIGNLSISRTIHQTRRQC